ncbi:type I restriction-modification system modification methylase S subunit [Candidatus Termititenax aidoneus]|uniref:Type I restriction-modification system modification methylase S subunit n=1 Tax=Termititenax aidoneus TaxID=2218524 RepID=A0A388T9R0_TERA1|nr:type I restriction-modification system modification methylase S subunit [Candidatus Termititenax aidoneus]
MTTQTVKLGEVCEINRASIGKDYAFDSIEYLDTSSVTSGTFSETEHLNLADAPSRAKRIVQNNDIVISTVRPNLRHFGIIQNAKPNMVVSTGFAVLTIDESKADYSYIYYLLTKDDIVDYLSAVADQAVSTYPAFNPSVLVNLDLSLPPLPEQQRVAGILGSLDEKIENNRTLVRTTEALARTIFKKHIAANEENKGWETVKLGDVCEVFIGGDAHKYDIVKQSDKTHNVPVFSNGIVNEGLYGYTKNAEVKAGSVTVSARGTVGFIKLRDTDFVPIVRLIAVIPKEDDVSGYFLEAVLQKETINASGSSQQQITAPMIKNLRIKLPPAAVLQSFDAVVEPLFAEIGFLTRENQTLAATRDKLLRKLIK